MSFKIQECFNIYFSPFYHLPSSIPSILLPSTIIYYLLYTIFYYDHFYDYYVSQNQNFCYLSVSNCFKIPFGKVFQGYIISSNKASSYMQFVMCFCLFSTFFYLATLKNKTQCSFTSFGCCNASISANFALSSHIICVVPPIKNVISIRCASILIFLDKYFFK